MFWLFTLYIFTGRNEVVVKVMFLLVSVILLTGGVLSQHALQQVSRGGGYPSMPFRLPGPHPKGKFRWICPGGVQAHTQEGSLGGSVQGVSRPTPKQEV